MAVSEDFKTFVIDQLSGFGPVSIRRMFGGAGVYHQGLMFALISDDTLYFKADASSQPAFNEEGMGPFVYGKGGKQTATSYWQAPDRLFDDPDELSAWGRRAYDSAVQASAAKAARAKPRKRRPGSS